MDFRRNGGLCQINQTVSFAGFVTIPLSLREEIDFAASLEGRTRTDFLISATSEKVKKVIEEHRLVQLSLRDQKMIADAFLDNHIKEPDEFLKGIREEYNAKIKSM